MQRVVPSPLHDVLWPRLVATHTEDRVEVRALPCKHRVVIKRLRFDLEVPLTDHRGLVARLTHELGQRVLVWRERIKRKHAIGVAVLPGQDRCSRGGADRVGAERIRQQHALGRELINRRRRVESRQPTAIYTDRVRRVVIRIQEQDVRPILRQNLQAHRDPEHPNPPPTHDNTAHE